ncbi:hypothetical protein TNCV_965931 [Trichonephila clavipes]|nr:hypothetical protein TNCV_965931 [Trichonephila clavipes]
MRDICVQEYLLQDIMTNELLEKTGCIGQPDHQDLNIIKHTWGAHKRYPQLTIPFPEPSRLENSADGKVNFCRDLTLHSAKLEIKRIFRESFRLTASCVARDKPWSTLCKKSHGIPSSPRAAAVAKFRLLTGHDCLCAHLFRFN